MNIGNWEVVSRPHGDCWKMKSFPIWVVYYPMASPAIYQTYKPRQYVMPIPKGRCPWTVDNVALSGKGFKTLDEAIAAGEAASISLED